MIEQHAGRHQRAADVVESDAAMGIPRHDAVDQHHPRDMLHKVAQFIIAQRFRMDDQRRAALTDQHLDGVTLFFRLVIAVADQHIFLMLLSNGIHCFHQRAEEGVGDVHHHHADGIADLGGQRLGVGVGPVAQLGHRFHHHVARIRTHQRAVVQHPRHGGHGYTRLAGDITNGDHTQRP